MVAEASPITIRPQPGPQEQFLSSAADVVVYGGAAGGGKSWALLMDPVRWTQTPGFRAAVLRRTYAEISNPGGLWDESQQLYAPIGGVPNQSRFEWRFEPDATIAFRHCQHEKNLKDWHGAQIDCLYIDEATHFTRKQVFYLLSRNRGRSGVNPYCRMTCNPDSASWLAEFIAWWIDPTTGYPIASRAGVLRWFVVIADVVHWSDSPGELKDRLRDQADDVEPKSCTFIPANLEDNPALTDRNPGYKANLLAQRHVDQERLLRGNWRIMDDEGSEWDASYFEDIWADQWPDGFELSCVFGDPAQGKKGGDYSAKVFVGLRRGLLYVDAELDRQPVDQMIEDVAAMAMRWRADSLGFETNGFQSLIVPQFARYCRDTGIMLPAPCRLDNYGVKKEIRIRRLSGWMDRIRLRRGSPGCELLLQQLRAFPNGVNDDGPDALEMAIRQLNLIAADFSGVEPEVTYR